jgi:crotonobetainyl-CoA:carnitine CoA-transferase CaiB-like acyl-CoA transferase
MTDLTEWASGGLAAVTRRPYADDPDCFVPVVPPGFQPQALAGLAAATGTLAACRWANNGRGPVLVDVSVQEVTAATLHGILPNFVWNGQVLGHPNTPGNSMGLLLPAADGDVYIRTVEAHQWAKLMEWVGQPEWSSLGDDPSDRLANLTALRALLGEWSAEYRSVDLLEEGQRRRVPIAVPRSLGQVLAWQHLRARGAWCPLEYEGVRAEAPRIPMLEPPAWSPTRTGIAAEVADRWSKR